MATIADRLRQFVDDEMTFPGNPDAVVPELVTALCAEVQRLLMFKQEHLDVQTNRGNKP